MARVAAQKTALPHNHPLHHPLKKRQVEACQRIYALWGVWPWELLVPIVMFDGTIYNLERPQDWSDNILDTLRKLALSTTLGHAVARIGHHAAQLKVGRISVRLAKAATMECETERERTPPNPKAGSGPILNRRNKKTLLLGADHQTRKANREDAARQLVSSRSSTPQSDGSSAMSPGAGDAYFYNASSRSDHSAWADLTLPKLHDASLQYKTLPFHSGAQQPTTHYTNSVNGLGISLTGNTKPGSSSTASFPFDLPNNYKRKTSPTLREQASLPVMLEHTTLPKRQTRTAAEPRLPGLVRLPSMSSCIELTPPTSPASPLEFSSSPLQDASSTFSPSTYTAAAEAIANLQRANSIESHQSSLHRNHLDTRRHLPPIITAGSSESVRLPPMLSHTHQRPHSYHCSSATYGTPIGTTAAATPQQQQKQQQYSPPALAPLKRPALPSRSVSSSNPAPAVPRGGDSRMTLSFLM
ncbi:hypothetical protein MN608_11051 [Microdochium nivale]|nr:hypothetical protein MN608_11051 [Microdochium nivale]